MCGWEYLRDFDVGGISFSKTGRLCSRTGCGGALRNNLLDWDDALPEQEFQVAEDALRQSDLCICMGTSLRIRPASELPLLTVKNGGKLVLVNLQKTPKDRHAHLRIQAPVDVVLNGVMAVLGLPVPIFTRSLPVLFVARPHLHSRTSQREQGQGLKCAVDEDPCRAGAPAPVAVKAEVESAKALAGEIEHVFEGQHSITGEGAAACKEEVKGDAREKAVKSEADVGGQGHERADGCCERNRQALIGEEEGSPSALKQECAHHARDDKAGISFRQAGISSPALWEVQLFSLVGRTCPLPLIERVGWKCGDGVQDTLDPDGKVQAQEGGVHSLSSILPLSRAGATKPGRLTAEIFLTDTCTFSSKCVEVMFENSHALKPRIFSMQVAPLMFGAQLSRSMKTVGFLRPRERRLWRRVNGTTRPICLWSIATTTQRLKTS